MHTGHFNSEQIALIVHAPIFRRWGGRQNGLNTFEINVLSVDELLMTERMLVTTSFWDWSWTTWFFIFIQTAGLFAWLFLFMLLFNMLFVNRASVAQGKQIQSWQLILLTWFMGHGALSFFAGGGVVSYYLATVFFPSIPLYIEFVRWFHSWFTFMGLFL